MSGRDDTHFSPRVWHEIHRTVHSVRAANCTARRFLEVDGPYGIGLTSVAGGEAWHDPESWQDEYHSWHVHWSHRPHHPHDPEGLRGTYMVMGHSRPVPLFASEFVLDARSIAAQESGCQPLDLSHATRAARGVALEEERFIYHGDPHEDRGHPDDSRLQYDDPECLLRRISTKGHSGEYYNVTPVAYPLTETQEEQWKTGGPEEMIEALHRAVVRLAHRGYAGPFALVVEPHLYSALYLPNETNTAVGVEMLKPLFRGGIYMAPVIHVPKDPHHHHPPRCGVVVTLGRAYARLIVGQDWMVSYRGLNGVVYRFLVESSLRLRISEPFATEVLEWNKPKEKKSGAADEMAAREQESRPTERSTMPAISGYQGPRGEPISSAAPGGEVVLCGSNLGDRGTVVFHDRIGPRAIEAASISSWTDRAVTVTVPSPWPPAPDQPLTWAGPVVITGESGATVSGPEFTILPPAPASG